MAMTVEELLLKFEADTGDAEQKIESLDKKTDAYKDRANEATKSNDGFFGGVGGGLAKLGLMATGVGAIVNVGGEFVGFLKNAAQASIEEQIGVDRLNNTLKNSIPNWDGNSAAIEEYIAKQQNLAFADDQLRDSLSFLVGQTKDLGEAQALQATAMDLARAKGISLEEATRAVAKVDQDSIGILKKLGIEVTQNMSKEEALAAIRQQSAGQAEAYANSAAGSMERMQGAFGNAIEDIGAKVMTGLSPLMQTVANIISSPEFQATLSTLIEMLGNGLGGAFTFLSTIIATVMPFIQGTVIPIFQQVFTEVSRIWTEMQPGIQQAMQFISEAFGTAWNFISTTVVPILQQIFTEIGRFWTEIQPQVQAVWQGIQDVIATVMPLIQGFITNAINAISANWTQIWSGIQTTFGGVWTAIQGIVETVIAIVQGIINTATALIQGDWEGAWNAIKTMFEGVWNGMSQFLSGIWTTIQGIVQTGLVIVKTYWDTAWNSVKGFFEGIWNGITSFVQTAITNVQTTISNVTGAIKTGWDNFWSGVGTFVTTTWNGITSGVSTKITEVQTTISNITGGIKTGWETFWTNVGTFLSTTWTNIVSTIQTKLGEIHSFITGLPSKLWDAVVSVGTSLIDGIVQGLKNAGGAIWDFISGIAQGVLDSIKAFFGIQSPSTVMAEVGKNLMLGLTEGAEGEEDSTVSAFDPILAGIKNSWDVVFGDANTEGSLLNMLFRKDDKGFFQYLTQRSMLALDVLAYDWLGRLENMRLLLVDKLEFIRSDMGIMAYEIGKTMAQQIEAGWNDNLPNLASPTVGGSGGSGGSGNGDGGQEGRGGAGGGHKTQGLISLVPATAFVPTGNTNITNVYIDGMQINDLTSEQKKFLIDMGRAKNVNNRGRSFNQ